MVYIDDGHQETTHFSLASLRKHYVSNESTPTHQQMQTDAPIVTTDGNEETGCSAVRKDTTYCGRITNAKRCSLNTRCHWDNEFRKCEHDHSSLYGALWVGAMVPVVYAVCYFFVNRAQISSTWKGLDNMHTVYLCSAVLATCSFLYILSDIMYLRAYNDTRHSFDYPLLLFFVGAMSVPAARALWILRDYSQNFVTVGLLLTSGGMVWLMKKYIEKLNVRHNRLGTGALYYVLFHVLLFDNFLWWWMVFSTSCK